MSDSNKRYIQAAAFGFVAVVLGLIGYWRIFTQFMPYDDEGGFLWSLTSYCTGGGLYDRVESLYGPFYFTFNHLLHAVSGLNFNHDTGRLLTLCYWCGTALVCGAVTWRQTRNIWAALAAQTLTFICLIGMIREPMHPSGMISLAVAIAVLLGQEAILANRSLAFAGVVALFGTAIALTKINIGAFFLIAAATWLAINSRLGTRSRAVSLGTALVCAAFPILLMRAQWPHPWVVTYVLIFATGALALTAAIHDTRKPEHDFPSAVVGIAAGLVLTVAVVIAASAKGTHWAGLWEGVVGAPLKFAQIKFYPMEWPTGARDLALGQAILAAVFYCRRREPWLPPLIAGLQVAAGLWLILRIPLLFSNATSLAQFCFVYGPSLAWLMALSPTPTGNPELGRARLWLAWVFIWQTLQAYPVVGSQVGWGSFLWIPLFVIGCQQAMTFWAERWHLEQRVVRPTAALVFATISAVALWPIGRTGYQRFTSSEALALSGAARLHLDHELTSAFRILDHNIRAHAGLVFTYPGLWSLNLWTDHPPLQLVHGPTEAQDRAFIKQLESDPKAVVVMNPSRLELLRSQGLVPSETLGRYLAEQFSPALRVGSYELWVRSGREIVPFTTAGLPR